MGKLARRGFLKQTSVSVATLGVLSAMPLSMGAQNASSVEADLSELPAAGELPEAMVAHIRDLSTGEISLLVGAQEIVYRDPALVMRLLKALP